MRWGEEAKSHRGAKVGTAGWMVQDLDALFYSEAGKVLRAHMKAFERSWTRVNFRPSSHSVNMRGRGGEAKSHRGKGRDCRVDGPRLGCPAPVGRFCTLGLEETCIVVQKAAISSSGC